MKLQFFKDSKPAVLLIYDGTPEEVSRLVAIFRRLSNGEHGALSVHEIQGMQSVGECRLHVRLGRSDVGIKKTGESEFECVFTAQRWGEVADLCEPFQKPWQSGHQYLSQSGKVQLIISTGLGW